MARVCSPILAVLVEAGNYSTECSEADCERIAMLREAGTPQPWRLLAPGAERLTGRPRFRHPQAWLNTRLTEAVRRLCHDRRVQDEPQGREPNLLARLRLLGRAAGTEMRRLLAASAPTLALVLAVCAAKNAAADEWLPCPGLEWQVIGADADERALVCKGVASAAGFLAGCGLEVKQSGRVRLVEELPQFCGSSAYGVFDPKAREIRLGRPALCVRQAPKGSVFLSLPIEAAFMSLAAHEATHALLFAVGLEAEQRMEHEYIAGVVQHAVLPAEQRVVALERVGALPPASEAEFSPFLWNFAPDSFAAKAWLHFEAQPDGCGFLRGLATGNARLPEMPPL